MPESDSTKQDYFNGSRPLSTEQDAARQKGVRSNPTQTVSTIRSSLHINQRPASATNLPRNSSTPSLNKKQPNRLKSHNRSFSHNKVLNKLSTSSSSTTRPHLNRSKSTEALVKTRPGGPLKRNSKSYTKISGLQPLTKTISSPTLKANKSNSSLKALALTSGIGLKSSARKGKAILRLNDDDGDFEDVNELLDSEEHNTGPVPERFDSQETVSTTHLQQEQNIPSLYEQINRILPEPTPASEESSQVNDKLEVVEEGNAGDSSASVSQQEITEQKETRPDFSTSTRSSTDDFLQTNNLYGGSLLLSQSTGLVRKIDHLHGGNLKMTEAYPNIPGNDSMTSRQISGISFLANPMETNNVAEPVTTSKNVNQNNSYQPEQTIFNNLQRTNNQYMTNKKQQQELQSRQQHNQQPKTKQGQPPSPVGHAVHNGANNFSDFLKGSQSASSSSDLQYGHNIETRTQQRLWLQRESSLMDVTNLDAARMGNFSNLSLNNLMFGHSYNNQSQVNMREMQHGNQILSAQQQSQHHLHQHQQLQQQQQQQSSQMQPGIPQPMTPLTPGGGSPYASLESSGPMMQPALPNTVQTRTEFERLNREYLNVRRHLNPVGESLKRIESISSNDLKMEKTRKGGTNGRNTAADSFEKFSPLFQEKETEITGTLARIWQDAILSSLSTSNTKANVTNPQHHPVSQRTINPRMPSYNQSYGLRLNKMPATRAG